MPIFYYLYECEGGKNIVHLFNEVLVGLTSVISMSTPYTSLLDCNDQHLRVWERSGNFVKIFILDGEKKTTKPHLQTECGRKKIH